MLLWLWCSTVQAAAALIQPLAWELLYAVGVALKKKKKRHAQKNFAILLFEETLLWERSPVFSLCAANNNSFLLPAFGLVVSISLTKR